MLCDHGARKEDLQIGVLLVEGLDHLLLILDELGVTSSDGSFLSVERISFMLKVRYGWNDLLLLVLFLNLHAHLLIGLLHQLEMLGSCDLE